jgi:hypothetical protein
VALAAVRISISNLIRKKRMPADRSRRHDTFFESTTWAYGRTRNGNGVRSPPPGAVTWILPLVAPVGTLVVISVAETTVNVASVPLKLTFVAPLRSVPKIVTAVPPVAKRGTAFTKGPSPIDSL